MAATDDATAVVAQLRAELERMTALRQEERIGRTRAEKALRELRNAVAASAAAPEATAAAPTAAPTAAATAVELAAAVELPAAESMVQPSPVDGTRVRFIGHIRSCFWERNGTPNQPQRVPASRAVLVMDRRVSLACSGGFDGLAEYSHVWITFLFHGNTGRSHLKAKVTPPRHGEAARVGIWACRSPHRVNELGLSLCEMVGVDTERGLVHLRGIDLIHNTPVVDIKPFIPAYDTVSPALFGPARVPAWVQSSVERAPDFTCVRFTPDALDTLAAICTNTRPAVALPNVRTKGYEGLYQDDAPALRACVEQTLQWDIRSHSQRAQGVDSFSVLLDGVRFRFAIDAPAATIVVLSCSLEQHKTAAVGGAEPDDDS